jgi:hypothetical protein
MVSSWSSRYPTSNETPCWGQHPRLQIVTVGELLEGKRLDIPPVRQTSVTYKRAPKAVLKVAESGQLFGESDVVIPEQSKGKNLTVSLRH